MKATSFSYKHLKFSPYKELSLWDVKRMIRNKIASVYPLVKLGALIIEQNNKVKLNEEPEKDFKILGVNNKIGLFDSYIEKGKNINQPYKKVEQGWLAFNPYRINVGSIGIKLPFHKYDYISPAYVVFSCKKDLLPEYLFLLLKTRTFNRLIKENTTGSVRQNLLFSTLSELEIPLPSIDLQYKFVDIYYHQLNISQSKTNEVIILENSTDDYIMNELNIEKIEVQNNKGLQIISFNNLVKWGVALIKRNANPATLLFSNKYKNLPLFKLVLINPYTKIILDKNENSITFLPMECISDEDGVIIKQYQGSPDKVKGYTKFKEGDLLWAKITPCMENGKSAIAKNLTNGFGYGSTEYHVLRTSSPAIKIEFLYNLLRMKIVRNAAISHFTGSAGQQRVPKSFLEELIVPVPPLEFQDKLINSLDNTRQKIRSLRLEAEEIKTKAIDQFEDKIFKS